MPLKDLNFTLIETPAALSDFYEKNNQVPWLGFDTEFVGEKRFVTLLCLIQVATPNGNYLIDPIKLDDLRPLWRLIEDPNILKITHAGENDYRIINDQFGVLPKNLFDAQVAAGFVGYKYPVSFSKLIEGELGIQLSKSYAVTDWETRPFKPKQLRYALNDVVHLYKLYQQLSRQLDRNGRTEWVAEELSVWEQSDYYEKSQHREFYANSMLSSLKKREKLFLLRLYDWRTQEAARKDYSKEMILATKYINPITRSIHSGMEALLANRRLPTKIMEKHGQRFLDFYQSEPNPEELDALAGIPNDPAENPKFELIMEMLHLLIKYRCLEESIADSLVLSRTMLKKLKADPDFVEPSLESGWRTLFLGSDLIDWINNRNRLEINFADHHIAMRMRS
ncbi:MAG: ribonuclease D [Phaeodactylibacter sp.]|nr:ribonuclease D [Phaeodactylibacter sp.]